MIDDTMSAGFYSETKCKSLLLISWYKRSWCVYSWVMPNLLRRWTNSRDNWWIELARISRRQPRGFGRCIAASATAYLTLWRYSTRY